MVNSIDEIIIKAEKFGLTVEGNRNEFVEFLERQLNKHPYYDLNFKKENSKRKKEYSIYFDLLVDKLYLFVCLIGKQEVMDKYHDKTLIDSKKKLALLRSRSNDWDDKKLNTINNRRSSFKTVYNDDKKTNPNKLMTYLEILEELLEDKRVIEIWGELNYNKDFKLHYREFGHFI